MSNNLTKLHDLLSNIQLSPDDQENFAFFFCQAREKDLATIVDLLTKNPDFIFMLNHILKAKIKATQNQDSGAWDKILEQERLILEDLSSNAKNER